MAVPIDSLDAFTRKLECYVKNLQQGGEPDLELLQTMEGITSLFREQLYREMAEENIFQSLLQFLSKAIHEIELASKCSCKHLDAWLQFTAECFRCQRNACVNCSKNQGIMRNLGLIDVSVCLIWILHGMNIDQQSSLAAFRSGLQYLGNMAAGNSESRNSIWKCTFPDFFLTCLNHFDEKVVTYGAMVFFTCLDVEKMIELQDAKNSHVAQSVVNAYMKLPESEWLFLTITSHFLKCPELVEDIYAKLSNQERITLLDAILAKISEKDPVNSEEALIPLKLVEFLASCFQETCKDVLKLASGTSTDEESLIVIRLLDVLCEMTCNTKHLECLQNCPVLLETVIDILRLTQFAGKQNKNVFTASHSVSEIEEVTHPAVGFKAHLIRLIANLCYKHEDNQEKVFHLDGIPLILDNCSIDDNNPFLNQWAVYAIRNLTEQNEKNQEVIANMERQGLADYSVLKNMGLQVEEHDGKLLLKSLKKEF
ncbi:ataxin-10 isoform X2 [Microcaecilia unicolor]|uniref:Ataxin-10 n=1 Tax=Microcaecilia unicolor TaxID=1415580 RepID=A0A6P7Z2Y9_9AMPH|nr:ataxin-10 isoform X2 [Microcaecilia unicolor]